MLPLCSLPSSQMTVVDQIVLSMYSGHLKEQMRTGQKYYLTNQMPAAVLLVLMFYQLLEGILTLGNCPADYLLHPWFFNPFL